MGILPHWFLYMLTSFYQPSLNGCLTRHRLLRQRFTTPPIPDPQLSEQETTEALIQDDDSMFGSMDLPDGDLEGDAVTPAAADVKEETKEP